MRYLPHQLRKGNGEERKGRKGRRREKWVGERNVRYGERAREKGGKGRKEKFGKKCGKIFGFLRPHTPNPEPMVVRCGAKDRLIYAKFHPHRCNVTPL